MTITDIVHFLIPKGKNFFILFEKASSNLVEIAKTLNEVVLITDIEKRNEKIKEIEKLEHVGDQITHEIFNELGSNFITPFDREDIHELASVVDDILDFIHGSAKRMQIYKIEKITPPIIKLAELILTSSEELHKAISELKNMKKMRNITDACVKINSIENHADDVFDTAVADLFDNEKNPIELIKYKEILAALETATDKCEDAANVLESIIVKNA